MKSKFLYWFVLFYIPFGCILYYLDIGFIKLQYYDEVSILLLFFYCCTIKSTKLVYPKEFKIFIGIFIFYLLYSMIWRQISWYIVLYDFQQQIKPYIAFYCFWKLKPKFTYSQKKGFRTMTIIATIFLIFSFFVTGAQIESTYLFGMMGQELSTTAMSCGLLYYSMSEKQNNDKLIFAFMISVGLLGGKSKMFAEVFVILFILFFLQKKLRLFSFKTLLVFFTLLVGAIFVAWVKFDQYYVTGMSDEGLVRPMMYKTSLFVLRDYFPFGSGFGTFATETSRVFYSTLYAKYQLWGIWGLEKGDASFAADTYYPSLAQFGVVGVGLFVAFWRKRFLEIEKESIERYKLGLFVMMALLGDAIADSTYVSNRGIMMWIILGLLISGSIKNNDEAYANK